MNSKIKLTLGEGIEIEAEELPFSQEIKIVKNPRDILKLLCIGTNIPHWPEFDKYILHDLIHFHANSIVLVETANIVAHVLVYHHKKDTLYFGFFGVIGDKPAKIEFMIDKLIEYAKKNKYKFIRGPINIPTIIYGWGFMEEGSSNNFFIHKPVNSPIYNQVFFQKGFLVSFKELSYEGYIQQFPSQFIEKCDFSNYELVHFDNWDDVLNLKKEFFQLNARNLPSESIITPDSGSLFNNYLDFIKQYGDLFMIVFIRYRKTNKNVGCFLCIPNPFSKDENNFYNSFSILSIVLDTKHRKKGLGWLAIKDILDNAWKHHIRYFTTCIGSNVVSTKEMSLKYGLTLKRTHIIFSYIF